MATKKLIKDLTIVVKQNGLKELEKELGGLNTKVTKLRDNSKLMIDTLNKLPATMKTVVVSASALSNTFIAISNNVNKTVKSMEKLTNTNLKSDSAEKFDKAIYNSLTNIEDFAIALGQLPAIMRELAVDATLFSTSFSKANTKKIAELSALKFEGLKNATTYTKNLSDAMSSFSTSSGTAFNNLNGFIDVASSEISSISNLATVLKDFKDVKLPTFKTQATNLKDMLNQLGLIVPALEKASVEAAYFEQDLIRLKMEAVDLSMTMQSVKVPQVKGIDTLIDQMEELLNIVHRLSIEMGMELRESTDALVEGLDNVSGNVQQVSTQSKRLRDSLKQSGRASEQQDNANRRLANSSRAAGKGFSDLAKIAGPLPQLYAVIFANLYALNAVFEGLSTGDRINRLEKLSSVFGATLGVNIKGAALSMQELAGGALAYEDALKQATKGAGYGFSTKDLEEMTLVARRAAVVLGVDMVDAMDRVIRGVSKQEIEILDELGITIRLTEAYSKMGQQLNKNANDLTSFQKQHAYLNAVVAQSTERFGAFDKQLQGNDYEKLGAGIKSLGYSFLRLSADALRPAVSGLNKILSILNNTDYSAASAASQVDTLIEAYKEAERANNITSIAGLGGEALDSSDSISKLVKTYKKSIKELTPELEKLKTEYKDVMVFQNSQTVGTSGFAAAVKDADAIRQKMQEVKLRIVDARESVDALTERTDELSEAARSAAAYFGLIGKSNVNSIVSGLGVALKEVSLTTKTAGGEIEKAFDQLGRSKTPAEQIYSTMKDISSVSKDLEGFMDKISPERRPQVLEVLDKMYKSIGLNKKAVIDLRDSFKNLAEWDLGASSRELTAASINLSTIGNSAYTSANNLNKLNYQMANLQEQLKRQTDTLNSTTASGAAKPEALQNLKNSIISTEIEIKNLEGQIRSETSALNEQTNAYSSNITQLSLLKANLDRFRTPVEELSFAIANSTKSLLEFQAAQAAGASPEDVAAKELAYYESVRAVNQAQKESLDYREQEIDLTQQITDAQDQLNRIKSGSLSYDSLTLEQQEKSLALAKKTLEVNLEDKMNNPLEDLQAKLDYEQQLLETIRARETFAKASFDKQQDYLSNTRYAAQLQETEAEAAIRKAKAQADYVSKLKEANAIQSGTYSKDFINQAQQEAERAKQEAERAKLERDKQDFGAVNGAMGGYQYTDLRGMGADQQKIAMMGQGMQDIENAFSNLSSYNEELGSMIGNLNGLANGFIAMGQGASNGLQVASASLQSIGSIINYASSQTLNSIQDQIDAEKDRDGKSAESVAKINKLEMKRIQEQKKAAAASIAINTAQGIMMAMGTLPFPYNLVQAGAVALMGAMAYQQAMSAKPNLTQVDSGVESLTLGSRSNSVDVSKAANSGEMSYIQGDRGTGSIQNFTPRAEGGRVTPGVGYIVGEKGAEPFFPEVPGTIGSSSSTTASSASSNVFHINAIDAKSFEQLVMENPGLFTKAVESDMNDKGMSILRK